MFRRWVSPGPGRLQGRTSVIMVNTNIDIPPGDSNYAVTSSITLPQDVEISEISPHPHWLSKDIKVAVAFLTVVLPTPAMWRRSSETCGWR
jgi:hypothetical protein